jgi:Abortive infection C-terminus
LAGRRVLIGLRPSPVATEQLWGASTVEDITRREIVRLVKNYIGVTNGYLGDFSYRTHEEFYPEFCELDISPMAIPTGTTRERFEKILSTSPPSVQAIIIRGILKKFPPQEGSVLRTQEMHDEFVQVAARLDGVSPVATPSTSYTSAIVERTLADAESLIETNGATSGVDRIHTAMHGYMRVVCDAEGITYSRDATINALFTLIRGQHPAFTTPGPRSQDITQILRAMNAVMDVLNPIRNQASAAHPNENLLAPAEAMLVINITRTMLHYIDAKLSAE